MPETLDFDSAAAADPVSFVTVRIVRVSGASCHGREGEREREIYKANQPLVRDWGAELLR